MQALLSPTYLLLIFRLGLSGCDLSGAGASDAACVRILQDSLSEQEGTPDCTVPIKGNPPLQSLRPSYNCFLMGPAA